MDPYTDPIERDHEAVRNRIKSRFGVYLPNRVGVAERLAYCALALALLAHATLGLCMDDLVIPSRRGPHTHLHGWQAWLAAGSVYLVAMSLISRVIDHHDKRDNEVSYRQFEQVCWYLSAALVIVSFFVSVIARIFAW